MDDTIAAISTPLGQGGIAIIRVSGRTALNVADRIFSSAAGAPSSFASHTIHLGSVGRNGDAIDQVLLSVMRAPRTYTGEDTVEINCHGGLLTARQVLELCLNHGARLAEPGEFTKRAFLNGRMDLTQAEAVMDVINAKTARAHAAAEQVLRGKLAARVNELRDRLVDVVAHLEAHIDFPEDDIAPDQQESIVRRLTEIAEGLQKLRSTAAQGRILREGVRVAIVGRPNVGKSSLLNALLGEDRAIVTPIAGTTRDVIEEYANIGGIPVCFADTAGIRIGRGKVEELGVERSREKLRTSDLALAVLDNSRPFSSEDRNVLEACPPGRTIIVINKCDLPSKIGLLNTSTSNNYDLYPRVEVSATSNLNIDTVRLKVREMIMVGVDTSTDDLVTVNDRHGRALDAALEHISQCRKQLGGGHGIEIVAQTARAALSELGEIVGKTTTDDILERVFSTFCIGK